MTMVLAAFIGIHLSIWSQRWRPRPVLFVMSDDEGEALLDDDLQFLEVYGDGD